MLIGHILKAGFTEQFAGNTCDIEKEKMVVLLGANKLFSLVVEGFRQNPCQHSHAQPQASPVDAIRALIIFKPVPSPDRGVHVIDDFPSFICGSCEHVKTTRKQRIPKE